MKELSLLLSSLDRYELFGDNSGVVKDIQDDSTKVSEGSMFVAKRGVRVDSHRFISQAVRSGASVIVGEKPPTEFDLASDCLIYVKVKDSREALGRLASAFYDYPSENLVVIGVTGTDGKTTTANGIYFLLNGVGIETGLISTVGVRIGEHLYDTGRLTTPAVLDVQKFLAEMVQYGCKYVVLETSSHALDQGRVAGVKFRFGVLTNITPHEHIDYHGSMKDYMAAKAKLFKNIDVAVLNRDDESFDYMSQVVGQGCRIVSYSLSPTSISDYYVNAISRKNRSMNLRIRGEGGVFDSTVKLFGEHNAANVLAAVATVRQLGVPWDAIISSLPELPLPKGRLQRVENNKGFEIYIDYAHTPNGLENVLKALGKEKGKHKLIVITGAEGERDVAKRAMMGEIAAKFSNLSILTSVDPGNEDERKIIKDISTGIRRVNNKNHTSYEISDRGEAISFAIQNLARQGDIVVICGKGHEKYIDYNGVDYLWSDEEAVKTALDGGVFRIKRG